MDAIPSDHQRVGGRLQRRLGFHGLFQCVGGLFGVVPYGGQQVLNRRARWSLRQQLGEAILHLGGHQAGAPKGRHALQFRHHKAARHTAVRIQRHPTGPATIGLKQPPRHRDFAPKGQPLLFNPLFESIHGALTHHGLGRRLAGLGQLQKARPSDLVQGRAQPGDRLSKRRRVRSLLQLHLPLADIFFQIRHTDREIFRIFHLGSPSGMGSNLLTPIYFRARNRDPIFVGTCVNQNLHP